MSVDDGTKRNRDPGKRNRYLERKLAGLCTGAVSCDEPIVEGRQMCMVHLALARQATAKAMKRRRRELRKAGLCLEDCGRSAKGAARCVMCLIRTGRVDKNHVGVNVATDDESSRFKTDSTGRRRYHGQMRRGRQPQSQLDDQDLKYAADAIEKAKLALAAARSPEVQALPRYQRDAAKRAALAHVDHSARFLEAVLDANNFSAGNELRHVAVTRDENKRRGGR